MIQNRDTQRSGFRPIYLFILQCLQAITQGPKKSGESVAGSPASIDDQILVTQLLTTGPHHLVVCHHRHDCRRHQIPFVELAVSLH